VGEQFGGERCALLRDEDVIEQRRQRREDLRRGRTRFGVACERNGEAKIGAAVCRLAGENMGYRFVDVPAGRACGVWHMGSFPWGEYGALTEYCNHLFCFLACASITVSPRGRCRDLAER
jgi:hypothetical protein